MPSEPPPPPPPPSGPPYGPPFGPPFGPPSGQWPPYPPPYPAWQPAPPPRRPRSVWMVVAAACVAAVLLGALALGVGRSVLHLGSPTVALAAPASIAGMPKSADYSSQPVTVLGQHVLDIASATYGSGDLRYAVVAISVPSGNRAAMLQMLAPQFLGDAQADPASTTHLRRSGVDYTCSRLTGSVRAASCTWDDSGVAGVVMQVGSDDLGRCADFADVARTAVRHG